MGRPSIEGLGGTRGSSFIVRQAARRTSTKRYVAEKLRWLCIKNVRGHRIEGKRVILEMIDGVSIECCDGVETLLWRLQCCRDFVHGAQERRVYAAQLKRLALTKKVSH